MNDLDPTTRVHHAEWAEAEARVRSYLQALELTDRERQEFIVKAVLQRAAAKREENPGANPTALAMEEIHSVSEQWIQSLLANTERPAARGFISLFAIDAPKKWPEAFLADVVPADFRRALCECEISAAPDLKVTRMVPQPFDNLLGDLNLPNALGELTKNLSPSVVGRAAALVLSTISFLLGNRMR